MAINFESDISYSVTSDIDDLETIRAWLYRIGEPETEHWRVLNKCKRDPDALAYFLRHAGGELLCCNGEEKNMLMT